MNESEHMLLQIGQKHGAVQVVTDKSRRQMQRDGTPVRLTFSKDISGGTIPTEYFGYESQDVRVHEDGTSVCDVEIV